MNLSEIQQLNPKKESRRFRERFQLKRFIERFAEFPAGEQEWDREKPDLIKTMRKWTLSADGSTLTVDYYFDDQRGSFEAKRVFVKR